MEELKSNGGGLSLGVVLGNVFGEEELVSMDIYKSTRTSRLCLIAAAVGRVLGCLDTEQMVIDGEAILDIQDYNRA